MRTHTGGEALHLPQSKLSQAGPQASNLTAYERYSHSIEVRKGYMGGNGSMKHMMVKNIRASRAMRRRRTVISW